MLFIAASLPDFNIEQALLDPPQRFVILRSSS
jgi:hypothetical protein